MVESLDDESSIQCEEDEKDEDEVVILCATFIYQDKRFSLFHKTLFKCR